MLDFGRSICGEEYQAAQREWLVTNGIGGYASGTIAGLLTRRYHGLLIAALKPPLERTLLLTKLEESVAYEGHVYPLSANRWADDTVEPTGFRYLERFRMEGTTPVWTFACADVLLEKRIWMQQGANTTYVHYTVLRGSRAIELTLNALVNYRNYHSNTYAGDWQMQIVPITHGLRIHPLFGSDPFYLLTDCATALPQHDWHYNFWLSVEEYRGQNPHDDHLCAGTFHTILQPGQSLTFVASMEANPLLDGAAAYLEHQEHEQQIIGRFNQPAAPDWVHQLTLAANQFLVHRSSDDDPEGQTILAGYHWFNDWGRDTMISLPGLTLITGQTETAARILRTFARFVNQGLIPNHFPKADEPPMYNTADATLWYIEAIRAYYAATGDLTLLADLFPVLEDSIAWHRRGTHHQICVDPADGLLAAGEAGIQLTWMDARIGDWVVTPRMGKPVEVNALWYNALHTMAEMARLLGKPADSYAADAARVQQSFARFWNAEAGYCYDVLDGPDGHEDALRPNQLLAVSLPCSPLEPWQQQAVVDVCARHLLTSHGLRSLSPEDPNYIGYYGGDRHQRDSCYHQGTVWAWLIGPFISAHLRVYNNRVLAQSFLRPLIQHLSDHGLGSISEIFDGDPPFIPRGCIAQAWSVAEVLRAWSLTQQ